MVIRKGKIAGILPLEHRLLLDPKMFDYHHTSLLIRGSDVVLSIV